jgi:hypothetical protein
MPETSDNHPTCSKNHPTLGSGWSAQIVSTQSTNPKITLGKLGGHRRCSIDKPSKSPTNPSHQYRRRRANHPLIIRRIAEIIRFQIRTPLESSELPRGRPNHKIIAKRCPVIVNSVAFNPSSMQQNQTREILLSSGTQSSERSSKDTLNRRLVTANTSNTDFSFTTPDCSGSRARSRSSPGSGSCFIDIRESRNVFVDARRFKLCMVKALGNTRVLCRRTIARKRHEWIHLV